MECNKPILWRHGLFLQPQHFQLNDLFQSFRLAPLWEFIRPQFEPCHFPMVPDAKYTEPKLP